MTTHTARAPIIDIHTHVHPGVASDMRRVMDAAGVAAVVNLGVLERLDFPFDDGMRAFRNALGDRMVYFPTPDFRDIAPGFGERMADALESKVAAGAAGSQDLQGVGPAPP